MAEHCVSKMGSEEEHQEIQDLEIDKSVGFQQTLVSYGMEVTPGQNFAWTVHSQLSLSDSSLLVQRNARFPLLLATTSQFYQGAYLQKKADIEMEAEFSVMSNSVK